LRHADFVPKPMQMTMEPEHAGEGAAYSYKPSLLGAGWRFKLTGNGIDWSAGVRSGHVPFDQVRRLHMSYVPMSMQSHRFVTELWAADGTKLRIVSTSWKSMVEQSRQDAAYSTFVAELHRGLVASGVPVRCERGRAPYLYWPGLAILAAVAAGLILLIVRALQAETIAGAVFIAAFLALFLWQGGHFFRRNRPGRYPSGAPPRDLMPDA
jgi:hypothetical protein